VVLEDFVVPGATVLQSRVNGCIEMDEFAAFLETKGATVFNFSRQPAEGSWSCQEVCPGYVSPFEPCPLCFGGAAPTAPDGSYFTGQTCREAESIFVSTLDATDDICLQANAQAYYRCGCPDLPPPREVPFCNLCPDGTFPPKPDVVLDPSLPDGVRDETCEAIATLVSYAPSLAGFIPFTSCAGFQNEYGDMCGCFDSARPMDGGSTVAAPPLASSGSRVASMSSWLLICALMGVPFIIVT
jgi:hypothetical protein